MLSSVVRENVQAVYNAIAHQWHGTRYKAWPRVVDFVQALPAHCLVADLGCGNGKLAPYCRSSHHYSIGCDFSAELVKISVSEMKLQVICNPEPPSNYLLWAPARTPSALLFSLPRVHYVALPGLSVAHMPISMPRG